SDGSATGTVMVADICPGPCSSDPADVTEADGLAWFSASDGQHGFELWRSDGSPAGTKMVADLWPGAGSSLTSMPGSMWLAALDGRLVFAADNRISGLELWALDLPSRPRA